MKIWLVLALFSFEAFAQFEEKDYPSLIEPSENVHYEEVIVGPTLESRKYYYRYITYFNTDTVEEYLDVPWVEENCHDDGDRFFNWNRSFNYRRSYEGGIGFDLLGISFETGFQTSSSVTMGYQRWVHAQKGIHARHSLKKISQEKVGVIHKQIKYKKFGNVIFSTNRKFPKLFLLDNQNAGLTVEREIISECE